MNCADFEERIALNAGGELGVEEAARVEQHLRTCAECAELARGLVEDRAWLASRPPEAAEVDFAAMRREIRREITRPRRNWKWLAAAAAILLAVGLAASLRKTPARTVAVALPNRSLTVTAENAAPRKSPILSRDRKGAVLHRLPHVPSHVGVTGTLMESSTQSPEPELTLESAIRTFQALDPESAPPPASSSPVEIRIATRDPNVTIILLHESKGDSL
jgi:anti-sigma factor RsiW